MVQFEFYGSCVRFESVASWGKVDFFQNAYYNLCRVHQTLRVTPAMESGLSEHVWSLEEIINMAEAYMPKPKKRGPYRKVSEIQISN